MGPDNQNTQNTAQSTPPAQNAAPQSNAPTQGVSNKTLMAVLAYLWILIIIPFMMSKDDPFVKFHLKQAAVLFVLELVVWVLGMQMISSLGMILSIVNLVLLVLSIMGIVHAVKGEEKEVPLVGQFAKHFNF